MKRIVTILIGIMLIAFGVGFLTLKLSNDSLGNGFNIKFNNKNYTNVNKKSGNYNKIDEKDKASIKGIKEIDIDVDIATINITSQDREDVSFHYHGNVSPHIKTSFNIKTFGDKLIVQAKTKNYKNNINTSTRTDLYLDIILPSSYAKDFNLEANLGSIKINGLELDKLYVKGDLGDINIKNTALNELDTKSSLGGISIENVSSSKNKLSTDLGAINTKNIQGPLEAKTNLGSINNNFPLDTSEKSDTKLKGKVGAGENTITLSVDLGSINIDAK